LVGALQLLVGAEHLLVGRLEFLVDGLEVLNHRLEIFAPGGEFALEAHHVLVAIALSVAIAVAIAVAVRSGGLPLASALRGAGSRYAPVCPRNCAMFMFASTSTPGGA